MIPLWNSWYFFQLYANAVRLRRARRARPPTRPTRWTATCWPSAGSTSSRLTAEMDAYAIADACETTRELPRRAHQLVHPPLARPVLGRQRRRVRHPLHGARDGLPGHRAAAAADDRGGLARADRRAVGAPRRLAARPTSCPADDALVAAMDKVREVCSATSALRKAGSLRNRLPLVVADGRASRTRPRCRASSRSSPTR